MLAPERIRRQGYFEPAVVTELLEHHVGAREDYSRQLWGLISFSLWAEQTAESSATAA
jgi:asparagine synthase (glutamine-hydrolysing)